MMFGLELPADPKHVGTARLFATAVGRGAGCPDDLLDDIALAVSEACTETLRRAGGVPDARARLQIARGYERLELSIEGPGNAASPRDPDAPGGLELISALFNEADERLENGTITMAFTVPTKLLGPG